ncbi:helix-turn-helix domain-containing protein [Polaromonas sp.]|uniref:helix-turn-helix domain-containing protein n=1 Tax=Polaromonas sp. TaxID=1869339 RepID=UPI003BB6CC31
MPFTPHPPFNQEALPVPLQGSAHQIRTVEAHDADDHAHNLTAWEQSYDQITRGPFHGVLTELQMPEMQVFLEHTSQAVRQSCCVWPDAFWFGVQGQASHACGRSGGDARINGRLGGADTIMVRPGNREFELLTPADYAIYGIVIRRDFLAATASRMGCCIDWTQLASAEVLHVAESTRLACLQALVRLILADRDDAEDGEDGEDRPVAGVAHAGQAVMMAVLSMLDTGAVDSAVSNSFMRRQRIVAQVRDHVLAHRDRLVTVPELCERLHVSRRTLQYCFEDVLGISPIQYLRIIRLNGARRELRESFPESRTVRDVAADWGFWHFSQFSSDYRKLFGQSPSESLRQRTH